MMLSRTVLRLTVILVVITGALLRATPSARLTAAQIEQAIEFGRLDNPAPYPLRQASLPGRPRGIVVGAVYTPFIRVALAAHAAAADGRVINIGEIPRSWL